MLKWWLPLLVGLSRVCTISGLKKFTIFIRNEMHDILEVWVFRESRSGRKLWLYYGTACKQLLAKTHKKAISAVSNVMLLLVSLFTVAHRRERNAAIAHITEGLHRRFSAKLLSAHGCERRSDIQGKPPLSLVLRAQQWLAFIGSTPLWETHKQKHFRMAGSWKDSRGTGLFRYKMPQIWTFRNLNMVNYQSEILNTLD